MRILEVTPPNPLTASFENLGALGGTGVFEVKPFKDWKGAPSWKDKIFTMRLCNTGEILDIAKVVDESDDFARQKHTKLEVLSRAIYLIDGRPLITPEELEKFNSDYDTDFASPREWIVVYLRNLENIVLDRLDAVYGALEIKQVRELQGNVQCAITGKIYPKNNIPDGSLFLKYALQEIITPDGMAQEPDYKELYDIEPGLNFPTSTDDASSTVQEVNKNEDKELTFEERKRKMEEADQ